MAHLKFFYAYAEKNRSELAQFAATVCLHYTIDER